MPSELSEDLFRFLEEHIDSVYQLELLLHLRTKRDRDWTHNAIAEQLHLRPESVRAALDTLCDSGLLQKNQGAYRFSIQNEAQVLLLDRVAQAYSDYRVRIINFIHSSQRLRRRDPIQSFADAFRLGHAGERDPEDDTGE